MKAFNHINLIKVFLLTFCINSVYANCISNPVIVNEEKYISLVKVTDATDEKYEKSKKVNVAEKVVVQGLSQELFNQVSSDPSQIAFVLGGKVLNQKSNTDFRMEIPGVLGFDFKFDVKISKNNSNEVQVELSNFNTFFNGGEGSVKIISKGDDSMTLLLVGDAYLPESAAKLFIASVGGENNFKKLLQGEIDKQINLSIDRFNELPNFK
tara:strand:+ start:420 stop:1049 length:630 start_codon:yes stop_codon:yes gene_type:complete